MPENQEARTDIIKSVALLVVDAQDVFIDTIHNKENFLLRAAFVIEAARSLRIRTIFTEQAPEKLGRANRKLQSLAWKPRTFAKRSFSALKSPGLEAYLRDNEIYHLIVCGLETPICIYQTALQAEEEDVDVTFLTDALGCRRQEDEAPVLNALQKLNCELLPSEALFYTLLGDVDHPYFRFFNETVKNYSAKLYDHHEFHPPEGVVLSPPEPLPIAESNSRNSPQKDDSSERLKKKRPRNRRSRNRGRNRRDENSPDAHTQHDPKPQPETEPNSEQPPASPKESQPAEPKFEAKPVFEKLPQPEPAETSQPVEPQATPQPDKAKTPPAKKVARKATRKTTTKRTAKKAAKKAARKTAKKKAEEAPVETAAKTES